ncbi:Fmp42p [Cyberlindnera jadinii NRRL Y-1542]|uniref:MFS general substrate transporter n=1 Tax=Cyberlindnera jadinii (strain ATCC 18201 / CBS 1600 / BCRC 20928 / JCM 3617 / NBRC 0987 / NRRL Y-1542) TaxID=983966 RepID=A0A1E4RXB7_CYBJN|nr:MFS general substrate transporter [Cyberlindnera jadinii NRRL Y-1542]ODV71870.1 MFS general substrate transporter [Cyberlindnera jadinii NRRL Y-1542]
MAEHPSNRTKIVQIVCAILWCLFAAGPVFGFAALKPILIAEGIYSELCSETAGACIAQDLKLNKMFTVAAVVTNVAALLVGNILDRKGPRVCGLIGSVCIALGALCLSGFFGFIGDPYITGYVLMALGGPFVFISSFQLANSFPRYSGMILALLTGAFDTSSAVFLCYRLVYQNVVEIGLHTFFTVYLVVPLFIFLCQVFIMPHESYKTLGSVQKLVIEGLDENGQLVDGDDGSGIIPDVDERTSLLSANAAEIGGTLTTSLTPDGSRRKSVYEEYVEHELTQKSGNIFGILDGEPVKTQLKSPFFILMCLFTTVQMIRINYFVATVRSQEEYLVGPESALRLNGIFDIALPMGGVIAIPFIGLILDNFQTVTVLNILLCVSLFIGVMGIVKSFVLNLLGILVLVVYRPFYYTSVSDYSAKVFGFTTFGQVYGLLMCISGIFNYAQSYFDLYTKKYQNNNPIPVNIFLVSLTVVFGLSLLTYITKESKNIDRKKLESEAERAPVLELPH